jgi:hypothetical protein
LLPVEFGIPTRNLGLPANDEAWTNVSLAKRRVALRCLGLLALLLAPSMNGLACTCRQDLPNAAFERADAVFLGRVIGVTALGRIHKSTVVGPVLLRVQVDEVWKGRVPQQVDVKAEFGSDMCANYSLHQGAEYILYPRHRKQDGPNILYLGGICPSRFLEFSDPLTPAEIKYLNRMRAANSTR